MSNITELTSLSLGDQVLQSGMTVGEMITSFRQAKNRSVQLQVLADLAGVRPEDIQKLLLANGVKQQEMPRTRKQKVAPEAAPENFRGGVAEAPPEPEPTAPQPAPLLDVVRSLVDRRKDLAAELGEIDALLDEMRQLLNMEGMATWRK